MKAGREHVVPLSDQALDILTTFQTCFPSSKFLHPGRYDSDIPISNATLNRSIDATVKLINERLQPDAEPFETFSVHDLRRTASTRRNEALFPKTLIEASLAHVNRDQVEAAYNHAKHVAPRHALLQGCADMIDCWMRGEIARLVVAATKVKIGNAAHDDSESFNVNDQILLEKKESMKACGLASPDSADALALTIAVPTPPASFDDDLPMPRARGYAAEGYDPMAFLEDERSQRGRF